MTSNIRKWLEDARGIYAVPEYLIDELLSDSHKASDNEEILDTIQSDIEALEQFKDELQEHMEEEEEEKE